MTKNIKQKSDLSLERYQEALLNRLKKREKKAKKIAPTLPLKVRRQIFKAACRELEGVMSSSYGGKDTASLIKLAKILRL